MSIVDRLDDMRSSIDALQRALELRQDQTAARTAWCREARPSPPALHTIRERHARLSPLRTTIVTHPERGRILLTREPVAAGEILLAEPALIIAEPDDRTPRPWHLVAVMGALGEPDRTLLEDLYNAHAARSERYAEAARLRGGDLGVDPETAGRWLGITRTNAFDHRPRDASAIHPVAAMASHACVPSADRFVVSDVLFVQARRALSPGEEVTISYLDASWPPEVKMPRLLSTFGFLCDCSACAEAIERGEIDLDEVRREADLVEERFLAVAEAATPASS